MATQNRLGLGLLVAAGLVFLEQDNVEKFLETLYASIIHDQELSIHASVVLLILALCDMVQTHPAKLKETLYKSEYG